MTDILVVDGKPVIYENRSQFTIRWCLDNGDLTPVLYQDGKRVTSAWRLALVVEMEADPHGGNANTA